MFHVKHETLGVMNLTTKKGYGSKPYPSYLKICYLIENYGIITVEPVVLRASKSI